MIVVKNSELTEEAINILNKFVELDLKAVSAFKLTRILKEISSIVEDKVQTENKILNKWVQKDENGKIVIPKDEQGNEIKGSVNITNPQEFTKEMNDLMSVENTLSQERIKFEDLGIDDEIIKVKDLMKIDFLFV
jgi:hypothetical protein